VTQTTVGTSTDATRRPIIAGARSRNMAPWDEIADDAAMESDYYLTLRAAKSGRRRLVDHPRSW
jgi:hypothetical protein